METTDVPQCGHRGCKVTPKRAVNGRLFCGQHAKKVRP